MYNIENKHGYNRKVGSGGSYQISTSYLTNRSGAILESEMPFENNEDIIDINKIQNDNYFPEDSLINKINSIKQIKYIPILENEKVGNNFSFADIAYIELTRKCNLQCKHCLNNSGIEIPNALSEDEMNNLVEKLSDAGLQEVRFTGGEPLLFPAIYKIIHNATEKGLFVSIGTNGTLINNEIALKLKKAGLKKAIVSIDGTEKMNDEIRGKGSFKKAINGIEVLTNNGIDVRINSVIMHSNMEDVISFAKEMHKSKKSLFIRRFIESGRGTELKDNTLNEEDYNYVRKELLDELETADYINGHYLKNDEGISYRIKLPFNYIEGCKAGSRALIISPEGNIHLCGFLAAQGFKPIGNVKNVIDWRKYWNEIHSKDYLHELRKKLEEYNNIPKIQKTNCLAYVQNYINRGKI